MNTRLRARRGAGVWHPVIDSLVVDLLDAPDKRSFRLVSRGACNVVVVSRVAVPDVAALKTLVRKWRHAEVVTLGLWWVHANVQDILEAFAGLDTVRFPNVHELTVSGTFAHAAVLNTMFKTFEFPGLGVLKVYGGRNAVEPGDLVAWELYGRVRLTRCRTGVEHLWVDTLKKKSPCVRHVRVWFSPANVMSLPCARHIATWPLVELDLKGLDLACVVGMRCPGLATLRLGGLGYVYDMLSGLDLPHLATLDLSEAFDVDVYKLVCIFGMWPKLKHVSLGVLWGTSESLLGDALSMLQAPVTLKINVSGADLAVLADHHDKGLLTWGDTLETLDLSWCGNKLVEHDGLRHLAALKLPKLRMLCVPEGVDTSVLTGYECMNV